MDPEITFEFEGQQYTVEFKAYVLGRIVLPDGRILEANSWLESYPPQPSGLHEIPHTFQQMEPVEIANLMNASVAEKR